MLDDGPADDWVLVDGIKTVPELYYTLPIRPMTFVRMKPIGVSSEWLEETWPSVQAVCYELTDKDLLSFVVMRAHGKCYPRYKRVSGTCSSDPWYRLEVSREISFGDIRTHTLFIFIQSPSSSFHRLLLFIPPHFSSTFPHPPRPPPHSIPHHPQDSVE